MRRSTQKQKFALSVAPLYGWTVLFVLLPLLYVVLISFSKRGEIMGVESGFSLDGYLKMADPLYGKVFLESFYTALLTTVLTLFIGYPFAYFTARQPKRVRGIIVLLLVAPFWLNSLIRLNGWVILLRSNGVINSVMQGIGIIDEPMKLLYTFGSVLVGMVYALAPFMILAIYNSVEKMDWTLVEAARDLGATPAKAFFTVTLPQTAPGITAGCVLVFVPSVGLFYVYDLFGGSKTMLLGSLIRDQMLMARNWPFGAALAIVMLVLTLIAIGVYKKAAKTDGIGGIL